MCVTAVLPPANYNYCNPEVRFGDVDVVLVTRATATDQLTAASSMTEWGSRINQTTVLPAANVAAPIRYMHVTGDLPAATRTTTPISVGRTKSAPADFTFNFSVDDLSLENIAYARAIQEAGGTTQKIWFVSGGLLYGGNTGVNMSVTADLVIPRGRTEVAAINYTCTFKGAIPATIVDPGLTAAYAS